MKKLLTTFLFFSIVLHCSGQYYLNMSAHYIIKRFKKVNHHYEYYKESDSTLLVLLRDSPILPMDFEFTFNKNGKCNSIKQKYNCDSCLQKDLKFILANKLYKWRKVDSSSMYLSRYIMDSSMYVDEDLHFIFFRTEYWSNKERKAWLKNKVYKE